MATLLFAACSNVGTPSENIPAASRSGMFVGERPDPAPTRSSNHLSLSQHSLAQMSEIFSRADAVRDLNIVRHVTRSTAINFESANGLDLTQADIDKYIDPRITGEMRDEVRQVLLAMPKNDRHNISGYSGQPASAENAYANTWEDLLAARAALGHSVAGALWAHSNGETFVATNPGSTTPNASGTGVYRKINSSPGYSALRGYVEIPHCDWVQADANNTPYLLMGGNSSTYIDSGLQWNWQTETVELYFIGGGVGEMSGSIKYPCTSPGDPDLYIRLIMGVDYGPTPGLTLIARPKRLFPAWSLSSAVYNADGTPYSGGGNYAPDSIPEPTISTDWDSPCSSCTLKREMTVAQIVGGSQGTDENSGTNVAMLDTILAPLSEEVRTPLEQYLNFTVGTLPQLESAPGTVYLNNGATPTVYPSDLEAEFKLLVYLNNPGTDQPGILLTNCIPTYTCIQPPE